MYRYDPANHISHSSTSGISLLSSALNPALLLAFPLFALHRSRPYRMRALSVASHSFPKTVSIGACVFGSSLVQRPILCSSPCLLRSACLWLWLWCTRGLADIPHTFHAPCNLTTACCTLKFSVASLTLKPRAVCALDLTPSSRFFTLASTIPLCQAVSTKALLHSFTISWLVRSYVGLSSRTYTNKNFHLVQFTVFRGSGIVVFGHLRSCTTVRRRKSGGFAFPNFVVLSSVDLV